MAVFVADGDQGIGDVAPMQQPRDQTLDRRFSAIPIDGYRNAAHIAPQQPQTVENQRRSLWLTVRLRRRRFVSILFTMTF